MDGVGGAHSGALGGNRLTMPCVSDVLLDYPLVLGLFFSAPQESLEAIGNEITTTRIQAFRVALRKADSLKDTRRSQLEDLRQEIMGLWEDFGCDPQTDLDFAIQSGPDTLGFDPDTMEKVKARADELRTEKVRSSRVVP